MILAHEQGDLIPKCIRPFFSPPEGLRVSLHVLISSCFNHSSYERRGAQSTKAATRDTILGSALTAHVAQG